MKDGFLKVCTVTPDIRTADCEMNAKQIVSCIKENTEAKCIVFPELCITGYTCGDLFFHESLLKEALRALEYIAEETKTADSIIIAGLPLQHNNTLYNTAAVLCRGSVIGFVPKTNIPSGPEHNESRYFSPAGEDEMWCRVSFQPEPVSIWKNQVFACAGDSRFCFSAEIGSDLNMAVPPSVYHTGQGANIICNLSAGSEIIGKKSKRLERIRSHSGTVHCAYLYANAGEGESTTDYVFAGHNVIAENGVILAESKRFCNEAIHTEIDLDRIISERRRNPACLADRNQKDYAVRHFQLNKLPETRLTRVFAKMPFVPEAAQAREERCEEVLAIQTAGLKKRFLHTGSQKAVIGLSGGLDSTLALLVTVRTFEALTIPSKNIICITMPCFGTSDRTYQNTVALAKEFGVTLREIPIHQSVTLHFQDIGHDINKKDSTYENSQARERTQILMDTANKENGLAVGTGDMSELALGWATYNGDHMSMYGVNSSVPKTLVYYLIRHYADTYCTDQKKAVLYDISDTPISPELLPSNEGEISQKTEEIIGPYELHDFFLYYTVRFGCCPAKILRMAIPSFAGQHDEKTIAKWLDTFNRRFFSQQFKRSCMPDGPCVGSVSLSPRGGLYLPSDTDYLNQ